MKTFLLCSTMLLMLLSCGKAKTNIELSRESKPSPSKSEETLRSAITLYATFDEGTDADIAKGDAQLYTVMNRRRPDSMLLGIHKDSVSYIIEMGKHGGALQFTGKTKGSIAYKSLGNISYDTINWSGAISFWLKLNPDKDLRPGYCDPIQITDSGYNDAGIWVDFTKTLPRAFRLGVIEDRAFWNPNPEGPDNENPKFLDLLVGLENPTFDDDRWTNVIINFSGLNTENGEASLFVNGDYIDNRKEINSPFTWEIERSNIYIGLSYIGLFDELAIFDRALTNAEIGLINQKDFKF